MKKPLCIALLLALAPTAHAFEVNTTSSPLSSPGWSAVKTYTVVYIDSRKLKVPLATALAQWPNEECLVANDTNARLNCLGATIDGAWSYGISDGFPSYPDPRDPRKSLKIDGLKQKSFANFLTPAACTPTGCPPASPPVPMTIHFDHAVGHFAMLYRFNWDTNGFVQWSNALNVVVNGQNMGTFPIPVMAGPAMVSVAAAPGEAITDIAFIPVSTSGQVPGALVGSRFYYD